MRARKRLKWIRRRRAKKDSWGTLPLDFLDLVILILVIALAFLILRISFIYAATNSPSDNPFHNFGKSVGLGSAFDLGLILSALLFFFWFCVSLIRLRKIRQSMSLLIWHLFIFFGIGMLAYGCLSAIKF